MKASNFRVLAAPTDNSNDCDTRVSFVKLSYKNHAALTITVNIQRLTIAIYVQHSFVTGMLICTSIFMILSLVKLKLSGQSLFQEVQLRVYTAQLKMVVEKSHYLSVWSAA